MKNYIKILFLVAVVSSLFTFNSCQNDNSSQGSNIVTANSTLKVLLSRVTQKRTSSDDVMDSTSCFTVKLPVTVIVNDQQVVVATAADYQNIDTMFGDDDNDNDHIDFVFPITVIFADFTELVVTSNQQLHSLKEQCEGEDVDNDDNQNNDDDDNAINCLSLNYPFVISTSNNGSPVEVTVNTDHDLYTLIETVQGSTTITINYPLTIVDANGATITLANNDELENKIEEAIEHCGNHHGDHENDDDSNHDDGEDHD
jgi:hypothetical protein